MELKLIVIENRHLETSPGTAEKTPRLQGRSIPAGDEVVQVDAVN